VQDVWIVFQMFDVNGDGNINLPEFEEITQALQQRLKRVTSTMQRTGAQLTQYVSAFCTQVLTMHCIAHLAVLESIYIHFLDWRG
jgi:hypothetical protein